MVIRRRINPDEVLRRILEEGGAGEMTRGEIAAIASSRERDAHDDERTARNRVGLRVDRAVKLHELGEENGLRRLPNGNFLVDDVGRWLRLDGANELYRDIPRLPMEKFMSATGRVGVSATFKPDVSPSTLQRALEIIDEQKNQIERMKLEEKQRKAEVRSRLKRR